MFTDMNTTIAIGLIACVVVWLIPVSVIVKRAGFSRWWVLLTIIPLLAIILLYVFAFIDWPAQRREAKQIKAMDP